MDEVKFALKDVRRRKGVTQVELSEKTGIAQQMISKYEVGEYLPQLDNAKIIADALGVTLDELVQIRKAHDLVGEKHIKLSKKV